jgi:hypothetical protein
MLLLTRYKDDEIKIQEMEKRFEIQGGNMK